MSAAGIARHPGERDLGGIGLLLDGSGDRRELPLERAREGRVRRLLGVELLLGPCGLDRGRLRRVLDHIEANIEGDLSLEQLAAVACLSRFHFARAFKAAVGRSPHRYVSGRRLEIAKEMIATGRGSLSEIALDCQFSSQSSFTRAFHRATGMTPAEYRRALR